MTTNMDLLSKIFIFIAGAGIGSAVTYKLLEAKFEQKVKEEIELTKEYYSNKNDSVDETIPDPEEAPDEYYEEEKPTEEEKKEYGNVVKNLNYTNYSNINKENDIKEVDDVEMPYVIPPEELGDFDDYEQEELTYYTDGVVADDFGNIVEDIEGTIGADFADHYGEYEEDSVYIRNDAKKCEYAVLRDYRRYSDVYSTVEG